MGQFSELSVIQESNMMAVKPETPIFSQILHNNCYIFNCMQPMIKNPTAIPTVVGTRFPRELLQCCLLYPQARNPRWRPPNRKYLYLSSYMRYKQNSNGYPHIIGDQFFNGAVVNTTGCIRKPRNLTLRYKY